MTLENAAHGSKSTIALKKDPCEGCSVFSQSPPSQKSSTEMPETGEAREEEEAVENSSQVVSSSDEEDTTEYLVATRT